MKADKSKYINACKLLPVVAALLIPPAIYATCQSCDQIQSVGHPNGPCPDPQPNSSILDTIYCSYYIWDPPDPSCTFSVPTHTGCVQNASLGVTTGIETYSAGWCMPFMGSGTCTDYSILDSFQYSNNNCESTGGLCIGGS
jgi:hypothetical protein